jgi:hypothetical protein
MRTATPIFATALVVSALVPSLASAANTPSISALAEVRLPEMLHPKDAPESLPGTESIEGLRLSRAHRQDFGTVEDSKVVVSPWAPLLLEQFPRALPMP